MTSVSGSTAPPRVAAVRHRVWSTRSQLPEEKPRPAGPTSPTGGRARMTETVVAEMMSTQGKDFDAMAPENISPLVVWLGSVESKNVTGTMFEVEGGIIRVAEGWAHGPQIDKGAQWDPAELGPVVADLLGKARPPVPVYGA